MLQEERQTPRVELPPHEVELASYLGRVVGDYELLALLGVGGMGAVFRARHRLLRRDVALKVLQRAHLSRKAAVERFLFEARAASQIRCEHIVEVLDFKTDSAIGPYLVMELLDHGISLEKEIRQSPLPEPRAIAIALQIATALEAAHAHGIVHRDLKPENVFLTKAHDRADVVKIIDFGIAKNLAFDDALSPRRTAAGVILGTPHYMSPEQCQNIDVDHRADIYALGAVLFEMLTGRPVFESTNARGVIVRHLTETPPSPRTLVPGLSPHIEGVILRCLSKEKEQRYDTARRLAADLSRGQRTRPSGRPAPRPARPQKSPHQKPFLTTLHQHAPSWLRTLIFGESKETSPRWYRRLLWAPVLFLVAGLLSFGGRSLPSLLHPKATPPQIALAKTLAPSVSPLPNAAKGAPKTRAPEEATSSPTSPPSSAPASAPTSTPLSLAETKVAPEDPSQKKRKRRPVRVAKKENHQKKFNIHLDE